MGQQSLFLPEENTLVSLTEGAYYLPAYCQDIAGQLWETVSQHLSHHSANQMMTPMGYQMSVKTTSMGELGWVSDHRGYGYQPLNPETQRPWPTIPTNFSALARDAAKKCGYHGFEPDTCLINLYEPGAKMGLHQDKDEVDFNQPIVSVSLGINAIFLFGGQKRSDAVKKCLLQHGDVVVFGGASRKYYHGVEKVKLNEHPVLGRLRCNLTFRKAS